MCGSMIDIQSSTAEIRRGKEEDRNHRAKIRIGLMSPYATQGGHKQADGHRPLLTKDIFTRSGLFRIFSTKIRYFSNFLKFMRHSRLY